MNKEISQYAYVSPYLLPYDTLDFAIDPSSNNTFLPIPTRIRVGLQLKLSICFRERRFLKMTERPIDMFPRTDAIKMALNINSINSTHVETVVLMLRKDK